MHISDSKLFQDMAAHMQIAHRVNPLAAQILSYFILDFDEEGVTFDEITEFFNASKSSVSTSIQLLMQMQFLEAFTKVDSRKRFFRLNRMNYLELRLQQTYDFMVKNHEISCRYRQYCSSKELSEMSYKRMDIYLDHIQRTIENIESTLTKLKQTHQVY
ncbi:MAG TPA: hypothetical protein PKA00_02120 [Saprospiraceae bacterium]|nr:hypothetical protein [Saprospiraceae bacterium]HMQ81668.1 hypothetical protein [Saprospiraceae bacterium]